MRLCVLVVLIARGDSVTGIPRVWSPTNLREHFLLTLRPLAMSRAIYQVEMSDLRDHAIVVRPSPLTSEVGAGDDVPAAMRENIPNELHAIVTNDDGGCAVHSIFGHPNANRELYLPDARAFAARLLGDSWERLVQDGASLEHVQAIRASLWYEFALPHLRGTPSTEGTCFWNALQRQSPMLAEEATSAYRSHRDALPALEATRVATLAASRSFFQPHVEISYIRPLAVQFGYLQRAVNRKPGNRARDC